MDKHINGEIWKDTDGNVIHAHGGCVLQQNGFYYWYGEDRSNNNYVNCYRSKNLINWNFRRHVLTTDSHVANARFSTDLSLKDSDGSKINIERPKVLYNHLTKQYVMWMHYENGRNYKTAACALAVSDQPDGEYTYLGHFNPLGEMSRDCTLFQDEDNKAYFISTAKNNADINIYILDDDYLSIRTLLVRLFPGEYREAPAVFKKDGTYYMLTSFCTGWEPNQGKYVTAKKMEGPWSELKEFGDSTTFHSQPAFVIPFIREGKQNFIYVGDRWDADNYKNSRYVFWPIHFQKDGGLELRETETVEETLTQVTDIVFGESYHLPSLLTTMSGIIVDNTGKWEKFRRPEIISLFQKFVYGKLPFPQNGIKKSITSARTKLGERNIKETILLQTLQGDIQFSLYLPYCTGRFRTLIYLCFEQHRESLIPIAQILERGYAIALLPAEEIAPDCREGLHKGILQALKTERNPDDSGLIGAWSNGLRFVMDYIETDKRLLEKETILAGFSRGGKCTLWTSALDPRFAVTAAFHSGCCGAGLSRWGTENRETIADITTNFPYWFCENFLTYAGKESDLPVDQHMLLSLLAPRYLFLSGSQNDPYANPFSEIESARNASLVFQLYGTEETNGCILNENYQSFGNDHIAYYLTENDGHTLTLDQWEKFLDFADQKLTQQCTESLNHADY